MKTGRSPVARQLENLATRQLTDIVRLVELGWQHAGAEEQLMRVADDPLEVGKLVREREGGHLGGSEWPGPITILGGASQAAIDAARATRNPHMEVPFPQGAYRPIPECSNTSIVAEVYRPTDADIGSAIDGSPRLPGWSHIRPTNGSLRSWTATSLALAIIMLVSAATIVWFVRG